MKIATWNINGLRARFDYIKLWLEARQPDVVGLQELKMTDDAFPAAAFEALGYNVIHHGQKAWNGVALLSRAPIEADQVGLPGQDELGARLIAGRVDDTVIITVYCPNGKSLDHADYARKLLWFDALVELLKARYGDEQRLVLCGDINICASALDSWRGQAAAGHLFHTAEEQARVQAITHTGLTDAFRHKHPDDPGFSWWDYRGGAFHRKQGLRIDSLFVTPSVLADVKDVVSDRDWRKKKDGMTASDHCPVWIEL